MTDYSDRSMYTDTSGWQKRARADYEHLSAEDLDILDIFIERMAIAAQKDTSVNIVDFLQDKNIELNILTEKGALVIVMFMEFFKFLEHVENFPKKYNTLEQFLNKYERFREQSPSNQSVLMTTANWVSVILKFIPAKKNKGLIICIVPKYVEGLQTRYVTGSGQTSATNDRVHIYEVEGEVVRAHRHAPRRLKPGEPGYQSQDDDGSVASGSASSVSYPTAKPQAKKRKRSLKADKPLLDVDDKFNLDSDADILSNDGLSIVAPEETRPHLSSFESNDPNWTPVGDSSPYLKKTKLSRDITWGIDINKKMKEEEDMFGFPPPHKSYHFAGETLVPADLCRSSSNSNLL